MLGPWLQLTQANSFGFSFFILTLEVVRARLCCQLASFVPPAMYSTLESSLHRRLETNTNTNTYKYIKIQIQIQLQTYKQMKIQTITNANTNIQMCHEHDNLYDTSYNQTPDSMCHFYPASLLCPALPYHQKAKRR